MKWKCGMYFVSKIVLAYCEKKFSSDPEKKLKFQADGQEFATILRSLKQFIQTVQWKASTVFETECFCNLFYEVSVIW